MIIGGSAPAKSLTTAHAAALKPVSLPAAELEIGARLRDHGRLRRVSAVRPAVASETVRIFFDDDPEYTDWLRVDVDQMITVWQDESDG